MCTVFQFNQRGYKPGSVVAAISEIGIVREVWAGFARNEILDWWRRKGGVLLDIPADQFAERSERTGKLVWDAVPHGFVIRGLLDRQTGRPLIKVVTREATPEELARFEHPRMPVLEMPLFERVPDIRDREAELF